MPSWRAGRRFPWDRGGTPSPSTLLLAAALVPLGGSVAAAGGRPLFPASQPLPNVACDQDTPAGMADQLMADRYEFPPFRAAKLPVHLTWAENPFHDANWQFQFHSLWWLLSLTQAWQSTGRVAYLDRALELAHSWVVLNPKDDPPSPYSWNDHSTALRSIVLHLHRAGPAAAAQAGSIRP